MSEVSLAHARVHTVAVELCRGGPFAKLSSNPCSSKKIIVAVVVVVVVVVVGGRW